MKVTAGPPTTLTGVSTTENFALAIAIAWTVAPAAYERVNSVVGALTYLVGIVDIATGMARGRWHRLEPVTDLLPGTIDAAF